MLPLVTKCDPNCLSCTFKSSLGLCQTLSSRVPFSSIESLEASSPSLDFSLVFMGGNEIRLLHFIFCDCFGLYGHFCAAAMNDFDYGGNVGECLLAKIYD